MRELPFELVVEILARVSVKDLKRFRCVCKSWRSLFQDERFIRQHMTHGRTRILSCQGAKTPPCHFIYERGKAETILQIQEVDLNIGVKRLLSRSSVIGHCHGLFCLDLQYNNTIGIWNPTLRELRRIPTGGHIDDWAERGFGYDHSTQDYKIVLLKRSCSKAQVLSLKSGVSRMIDFPFEICHNRLPGTLVGENFYWKVFGDHKSNLGGTFLSFNLVSETFNYCPGPRDQPVPLVLDEFRGGLCTIGMEDGDLGKELVIWSAQHDKGVIKSWIMIIRLSWDFIQSSISPRDLRSWLRGAVTYEGDLLLLFVQGEGRKRNLLAYNLEEKSLRIVETDLSLYSYGSLHTYIETLVPPIPGVQN